MSVAVAVHPAGRWLVPHVLSRLDLWLEHVSGGKLSITGMLGFPLLILTTRGVITGQTRETPLIYLRNGEEVAVIASALGSPQHPQWYRNLLKDPEASLFLEGQRRIYSYRLLAGQERRETWQRMLEIYPGYDKYAEMAGRREIPVILFTPLE